MGYIIPNTRFKPFSFEEMLKPVMIYKEAYDKANAELNALYEDAATKGFNFASQDTAEKAQYDAMMNRLKSASDALSSGDKNAFKTIRDINKEYRQTMIPIQQQIAKRAELAAEQRNKQGSNPNLRFSKDFSKASLSDITASSSYETYNLKDIREAIGSEFAGLVSGYVRDDIPIKRVGTTNDYVYTTGVGYTKEQVDDAFYGNDGKPKEDSYIYQYYKQKANAIDSLEGVDDQTKTDMKNSIKEAIIANSGKFKTEILKDPFGRNKSGGTTEKILEMGLKNTPELIGLFEADAQGFETKGNYMINGTMHKANIKWVDVKDEKTAKELAEKGKPVKEYTKADGSKGYKIAQPFGFIKVGTEEAEKPNYSTITEELKYNQSTGRWEFTETKRETRKYWNGVETIEEIDKQNTPETKAGAATSFGKGTGKKQ